MVDIKYIEEWDQTIYKYEDDERVQVCMSWGEPIEGEALEDYLVEHLKGYNNDTY